jgi:hypothetical protein
MLCPLERICKRARNPKLRFIAVTKRCQMRRTILICIISTLCIYPNFSCKNGSRFYTNEAKIDSTSKFTVTAACKVYKIDSINDYYLIYIVKEKYRYKVISKKSVQSGCIIVKPGNKYDLQITYVFGAIGGGVFKPNCLDVDAGTRVCLEDSIIDLCYAKNLKGLCVDDNK